MSFYLFKPAGGGSGRVCVWAVRGARRGPQLAHARAAAAAFLPRRVRAAPRRLLVLTADGLHIVRSLTGGTEGGARRGSCTPAAAPPCAPCTSAPRPPCRARSPAAPRGERVVCCAPRARPRPPCAAPDPPPPVTCKNNPHRGKRFVKCSEELKGDCGAPLDRVAMRLAAAERVRRLDYEREVAEREPPSAPVAEPYKLAGEHECLRATDGRDYTVSKPQNAPSRCSSNREPPPPCPIDLKPSDACEISRGQHLDPCEHQPRVFLEIDRSSNARSTAPEKQSNDTSETSKTPPKPSSSAGRFTTRILESLKRSGSTVCPRKSTSEKTITRSVDNSWCENLPPPKSVPVSCKEQSLTERLRQRPGGKSSQHCNPKRNMHTKTSNTPCSSKTSARLQENTKQDKSKSSWHERAELKEAGQGRVVPAHKKEQKNRKMGAGGLELNVPPNTEAVRVRVSLDFKAVDTNGRCINPVIEDDTNSRTLSSCHSIGGSNSWLSIKNLQKKFSRKKDTSTEVKTQDSNRICARPNGTKKAIPEKQSDCSVGQRNKQTNDSSSNTPISQRPCPPSPCTPRTQEPKSRFASTRDFLIVL
ncbi:uncharacterized protein LOC123669666 [Melitaea cinxia]|uniref:uncharacterized protein LOC123669666 n=1 Tax=Melitaea cinxia TaxID=113334 RepID=UPI001E27191A|nr:uncharacterized protein LOC123669666 [Melitaea cinxia]